ncbi:hypothetical protein F4861DRAFT_48865 [Xylaria intraflava]|nr:hypothetical protein F4861DRAFT_48865 [Xylaria intraflava]
MRLCCACACACVCSRSSFRAAATRQKPKTRQASCMCLLSGGLLDRLNHDGDTPGMFAAYRAACRIRRPWLAGTVTGWARNRCAGGCLLPICRCWPAPACFLGRWVGWPKALRSCYLEIRRGGGIRCPKPGSSSRIIGSAVRSRQYERENRVRAVKGSLGCTTQRPHIIVSRR